MHEHHRNVPYAAENRSRSSPVAGLTGANVSLATGAIYPERRLAQRAVVSWRSSGRRLALRAVVCQSGSGRQAGAGSLPELER
jgi:hypothetical protein